jgi:hypothetical protein
MAVFEDTVYTGDLLDTTADPGNTIYEQVALGTGQFRVLTNGNFFTGNIITAGLNGTASGGITYNGSTSGSCASVASANAGSVTWPCGGNFTAYNSGTNCGAVGSAANPSLVACASAAAGSFSASVSASAGTAVVSDTRVTANSEVVLVEDPSESTRLSVTCNTAVLTGAFVSAKSAGTSFTVTLPTFAANPMCFSFWVVN